MNIKLRLPFHSPSLGKVPATTAGKPTVVDLPADEAVQAQNSYRGTVALVTEKVNFKPVAKGKK
ncbi:hypothetical protein NFHSH190041_36800 (plasmid) [Shewanella sp. NFH-SH190041]|uniref:hypothetical protein n=1 Tax=Shewanella sp. NFH-SH190041 TaxID=2950245 RepID=UPI0021C27AA2|nr:hypothetical protein [Shewanella sp. NFH-SH190041]BDM66228.1 hypothetical protein NFHSH190041_36800 [Shewanella sp. NFH-SH190041]